MYSKAELQYIIFDLTTFAFSVLNWPCLAYLCLKFGGHKFRQFYFKSPGIGGPGIGAPGIGGPSSGVPSPGGPGSGYIAGVPAPVCPQNRLSFMLRCIWVFFIIKTISL